LRVAPGPEHAPHVVRQAFDDVANVQTSPVGGAAGHDAGDLDIFPYDVPDVWRANDRNRTGRGQYSHDRIAG
jgi:hypothetical protein